MIVVEMAMGDCNEDGNDDCDGDGEVDDMNA